MIFKVAAAPTHRNRRADGGDAPQKETFGRMSSFRKKPTSRNSSELRIGSAFARLSYEPSGDEHEIIFLRHIGKEAQRSSRYPD